MKENNTSIELNTENEQKLINTDKQFKQLVRQNTQDVYDVWKWLDSMYKHFDENQSKKHWWQKIGQDKSKGMAHLKHVYEKYRLAYLGPTMERIMKTGSYVSTYCFSELLYKVLESVEKGANKAKTGYTKTADFKKNLSDNMDKLLAWQTKAAGQMEIELGTAESLTKGFQSIFKNMNGQNIGKSIKKIENNLGLGDHMTMPQNGNEAESLKKNNK
jgi:flagellar hook-basal body complex protein FliE